MMAARFRPDAISESNSTHLPPIVASVVAKPVTFPLGRSSRGTMPRDRVGQPAKTIGIVRVSRWGAAVAGVPPVRMMSGCKPTNSCASARIRLMSSPAQRRSIRTLQPSVQPKPASASERGDVGLSLRIVFVVRHEHADAPHAAALLRARRERPCCRRAAERGRSIRAVEAKSSSGPPVRGPCEGARSRENSTPQACGPAFRRRGEAGLAPRP
jgi:hypothetical protein